MRLGRNARTIRVYCAHCGCLLYKYVKAGPGRLVKCFKDRIVRDDTERSSGDIIRNCPLPFCQEFRGHGA